METYDWPGNPKDLKFIHVNLIPFPQMELFNLVTSIIVFAP